MTFSLDPVRKTAESFMVDTVKVTRDPDGFRNETFNQGTGQYDGPDNSTTIYASLKAYLWAKNYQPRREVYGGQDYLVTAYGMLIPYDTDALQAEDLITVVTSTYDPLLVGHTLIVVSLSLTTMAAVREVYLEDRARQMYPR